jgi:hypothetical protein
MVAGQVVESVQSYPLQPAGMVIPCLSDPAPVGVVPEIEMDTASRQMKANVLTPFMTKTVDILMRKHKVILGFGSRSCPKACRCV